MQTRMILLGRSAFASLFVGAAVVAPSAAQ